MATRQDATQEVMDQKQALTARLEAAHEQLAAHSEAFLERSRLQSALGNRLEGLDDAKRALYFFPAKPKVSHGR